MFSQRFSLLTAVLCVLAMANDGLAAAVLPGTPQIPFDANIFATSQAIFTKKGIKITKAEGMDGEAFYATATLSRRFSTSMPVEIRCFNDHQNPTANVVLNVLSNYFLNRNQLIKENIAGVVDVVYAGTHPCYVTAIPRGVLPMDYLKTMAVKDKITNAINILNQIIDIRKRMVSQAFTYTLIKSGFVHVARSLQGPSVTISLVRPVSEATPIPPNQRSSMAEPESGPINAQSVTFNLKAMLSDSRKPRLSIFASSNQVDDPRIAAMEAFLKTMFSQAGYAMNYDAIRAALANVNKGVIANPMANSPVTSPTRPPTDSGVARL
ncbi:hypothetical protein BDF22DRAFT_163616 [Syncephalis plumigaleata]|nr:hypothetical protein BDF22DRAFT_163616 [Syncephalis plumigaleata]